MSAKEALGKLRLPEGFRATLFASEPDIQNPIAATWDHKGRLWVAENYTYAERQKRFDLGLNDRVIILEDKDNDGKAESRKVFTDQVQMLTSVELGRGGVWLMCPPQLLFIPDANADDIPDGPPEVILDGFLVAEDNYHNFANGLRWGPDGWLYGRCGHGCPAKIGTPGTADDQRIPMKGGIWRYHPERKTTEVLCHGTTNPWGHDWDENGEMFFSNTVIGHLWHMIPGAQFKENTGESPNPFVYERMDQIADHYHYDTGRSWMDSRDGKASDFGGGHSHIGGMIYQADQWPEPYRGKYMTLNQHGRRVNVERIEPKGSGYTAKHEPDIIFSDDSWFRGLDLTTGPDGSVFILDWSDTGECHDLTGVHRESGRIYKISYGEPVKPDLSPLSDLTPDNIDKLIRHPNAWFYRQMRNRLLDQDLSSEAGKRLQATARKSETNIPRRLRALWLLFAKKQLSYEQILPLLTDENEHVRTWGIRFLTDSLPLDSITGNTFTPEIATTKTAKLLEPLASDQSGLVKLTLSSSLQRLPREERMSLANRLVRDENFKSDPFLPYLIWNAMANVSKDDLSALLLVLENNRYPRITRWISRFIASQARENAQAYEGLFILPLSEEMKIEVLEGITEAFIGLTTAPKPQAWNTFSASIKELSAQSLVQKISILFGDTATISHLKNVVLDEKTEMGERRTALDILIDSRIPNLTTLCQQVITIQTLNGNALRGLALSDDVATAKLITDNYGNFLPADHSALMDILASRSDWAAVLLDQIASGKIPKSALPAYTARRIRDLKNTALSEKLDQVWGTLNDSAETKDQEIAALKSRLAPEILAKADLKNGRKTFSMVCSSCHMLYGEGGVIGPDLTGSGRGNIDYLLENILAPSAVVGADYRLTSLSLRDGRTLAGVITARTDKTMTLRLPTGESTLELSEISKQQTTPYSMMPEGLLTILSDTQVRDIIAYLMHPEQVALPD
ncbi:MAG: c-type cytochrome [Armatimonadetes bacterium]|nr:c-type cytochrome [Akkermansiaceae bacterium]